MLSNIKTEIYTGKRISSTSGFRVVKVYGKEAMTLNRWCCQNTQNTFATSSVYQDWHGHNDRNYRYFAFSDEQDLLMFLLLAKEHQRDCAWETNTLFTLYKKTDRVTPKCNQTTI